MSPVGDAGTGSVGQLPNLSDGEVLIGTENGLFRHDSVQASVRAAAAWARRASSPPGSTSISRRSVRRTCELPKTDMHQSGFHNGTAPRSYADPSASPPFRLSGSNPQLL